MLRRSVLLLMASVPLWADLDKVKAEPKLEKRSKLALDNAGEVLNEARKAYRRGELQQVSVHITEFRDSVTLAETSLKDTGKNPRKSPKWFKRAEIQSRDLLRRIDAFSLEMSPDDRTLLGEARAKLQQVHEDLLRGVMEGKRK